MYILIYHNTKMPEENVTTQETSKISNWNPFNLVDEKSVDNNTVNSNTTQNEQPKQEKWPNDFFRSLIKLIAKLAGQPDPETGEKPVAWAQGGNGNNVMDTAMEKAKDMAGNVVEKAKNNFDNVMNGVSDVMWKLKNKIGQKAWDNTTDNIANNSEWKSELEKDIENQGNNTQSE